MKLWLLILVGLCSVASAAPGQKITDFVLTDQEGKPRTYRFPKSKVTVMTVADRKGSEQLAPWIQRIRDHYQTRIDIDGIADMSIVPKFLRDTFRQVFRKQLAYSVMLDWEGKVVKQFTYQKGVANIYLLDRDGRIVKQFTGPIIEAAAQELFNDADRVISEPLPK